MTDKERAESAGEEKQFTIAGIDIKALNNLPRAVIIRIKNVGDDRRLWFRTYCDGPDLTEIVVTVWPDEEREGTGNGG